MTDVMHHQTSSEMKSYNDWVELRVEKSENRYGPALGTCGSADVHQLLHFSLRRTPLGSIHFFPQDTSPRQICYSQMGQMPLISCYYSWLQNAQENQGQHQERWMRLATATECASYPRCTTRLVLLRVCRYRWRLGRPRSQVADRFLLPDVGNVPTSLWCEANEKRAEKGVMNHRCE